MKTIEETEGKWFKVDGHIVRICDQGLVLFKKYRWKITFVNHFLHRHEKVPYLRGVRYRVVPFHREVLGLFGSDKIVKFKNDNKLDCRFCNLSVTSWR